MRRRQWCCLKEFCFLALSLGLMAIPCFAATVRLKDGKIVEGEILERTSKRLKLKSAYGPIVVYRIEDVESVEYDPEEPEPKRKAVFPLSPGPAGGMQSALPQRPPSSAAEIFEYVSPGVVVVLTKRSIGESQGSGFIVDKNGLVVTSFHNVAGAEEVQVKLRDGRLVPGIGMVYQSPTSDLCIFRIQATGLPVLPLGDSDRLKPGQLVLAIGSPLGFEASISDGILSGVRNLPGLSLLQFTAPVSPGSSGGPLVNVEGQVIGMVIAAAEGGQNLNMAVPINQVKEPIASASRLSVIGPIAETTGSWQVPPAIGQKAELLRKARIAALNEDYGTALRHYDAILGMCDQDIEQCFTELIETLATYNMLAVTPLKTYGLSTSTLMVTGRYARQCVDVMQVFGGPHAVVKELKKLLGAGQMLEGFKEHTLGGCYWMAGLAYVDEGDIANARDCLRTLKQLSPKSENVSALETALKERTKDQSVFPWGR